VKARALQNGGDLGGAEAALQQALTAVAARLAGDPEHDRIYDFDAFVRTACLETPEGWSDLASYLADLKAALERLHVFKAHPLDQSLRVGSQTTQPLLYSEDPASDETRLSLAFDVVPA
jgi:hypothetical protein